MITPEFEYDWFTPIEADMTAIVPAGATRIIEIGAFEGKSTLWFLNHCPTATITVIDHFKGSDDMEGLNVVNLYQRFLSNTAPYKKRLRILRQDSWLAMRRLGTEEFDLVFVEHSTNFLQWNFAGIKSFLGKTYHYA